MVLGTSSALPVLVPVDAPNNVAHAEPVRTCVVDDLDDHEITTTMTKVFEPLLEGLEQE
jgi:hypothetical protein